MGLNETPSSERIHIAFFGKRNAGKSSILNAITNQELAVVSNIKGTTTDPVQKAMELLPLGPVVLIDTPGIDDEGELGELRIKKSYQVLNKADVAILVVDATIGMGIEDEKLRDRFLKKEIPYLIVLNKADQLNEEQINEIRKQKDQVAVSALTKENIEYLKERIATISKVKESKFQIIADVLHPADFVVLVVPIDKAAPKGRLILPQQQTIRDVLEADATAIVVKEYELKETLESLGKKPRIVITDSQVFAKVSADTPKDIWLTSFSILMARHKGVLEMAVKGAKEIDRLQDKDKVLISEGCTHHKQCDDIGTVKLPRWIKNYTGKEIEFEFSSGTGFPDDLSPYKLVIHCGGCTLNEREMRYRQQCAKDQNIPYTNYGISIAFMQGILQRSIEMFPALLAEIEDVYED